MPNHHRQRFVLVVEDDKFVIEMFQKVFSGQEQFLLDTSETIVDAMSKIKTVLYDLIFLDMKIGHAYAGMEVLRELNRMAIEVQGSVHRQDPSSLVVIMSASVPLQDVMEEAHSLGVICFIDKPIPFTEDFLLRIINRVGMPLLPRRRDG